NCPDAPGSPTCDRLDAEATEARYLRTPLIAVCGWSDDEIARHLIVQATQAMPKVGEGVKTAAEENPVLHDDTGPEAGTGTGIDTGATAFFRQHMGVTDLAAYEARVADRVIEAEQAAILAEHGGARAEAIVLKGNTTLPDAQTLGSREQPVVLVIDGDWLGGAPTIWGVVYVRGSVEFVDIPAIHGALIVEGTFLEGAHGEALEAVEYDADVLDTVRSRIGASAPKPGTWRDWSKR
ncbi:MAG: hypothetical protein ACLFNA_00715, partial [Halochromatium sp.]